MRVHLLTAPLRSRYNASSQDEAVEVPDEKARYLCSVGIARRASAPSPRPQLVSDADSSDKASEPKGDVDSAEAEGAGTEDTTPTGDIEIDYEELSKPELVQLAEKRGLTVTRADGDGPPLKDDYVAALRG